MKKSIVLIIIIILLIFLNSKNVYSEVIIPDEAIRFRVIGNSNSIYDQNVKIQIRNILQNEILSLIDNSENIDDTRKIIKEHIEELSEITRNKLNELGYDKSFKINYGYNYFPEKNYKGVKYKEGYYESLVVTLGNGDGDNFWCVLFPPLCTLETNDSNIDKVEYSFFIKEIIEKFFD